MTLSYYLSRYVAQKNAQIGRSNAVHKKVVATLERKAALVIDYSKGIILTTLHIGDVGQIIQLAIAPVFLLTGVGTKLTVLTNRLARILDRSRVLEDQLAALNGATPKPGLLQELDELYERGHLINWAITLCTTCGLFICLVIACLFLGDAVGWKLDTVIAVFFVSSVFCLIGSFIYLLREIFVATKTLSRQREHGRRQM